MRLGFYYHTPIIVDKERRPKTLGPIGCFIDSLAEQCEQVVCFAHWPLQREMGRMDYELKKDNIEVVHIGPHLSLHKRMLNARRLVQPLKSRVGELDAMFLRGPTPLLPSLANASGKTPLALLIVGNYLDGIDELKRSMIQKEIIRLFARWNFHQQMKIARNAFVFVNSHKLYSIFDSQVSRLKEVRTSTLTQWDFFVREDTCQTPPVHLLYTGRMSQAKGLFTIIETLGQLVARGYDVILDLVGWIEKGEPTILEELTRMAAAIGVKERVTYHGAKTIGEELFFYYRNADIYLIPSFHEGFPRTIWEAMAHSMPVVATNVGGIPSYLESGISAMLITPGDPAQLTEACVQLLENASLRRQLIRNGLAIARENTLEKAAATIVRQLSAWLKETESEQ